MSNSESYDPIRIQERLHAYVVELETLAEKVEKAGMNPLPSENQQKVQQIVDELDPIMRRVAKIN